MNVAEIQQWRQQTEIKREADRQLALLAGSSESRQDRESGIDFEELYFNSERDFRNLYIAHAKAAHLMVRNLMVAPQSEYLGPVTEKPRPLYNMLRRSVGSDDIGTWEATANVRNGEQIDSETSVFGFSARHLDGGRETILEPASPGKITFTSLEHTDWTALALMSSTRETIATVCEQAGVEVIPVTFNPVYAGRPQS